MKIHGWETWIDIIIIFMIVYFLTKKIKKPTAEDLLKMEEENEAKAKKLLIELEEKVKNINTNPHNEDLFSNFCMQSNNTLVIYHGVNVRENEIVLNYTLSSTPPDKWNWISYTPIELERAREDRKRFLKLEKELEYFNLKIIKKQKSPNGTAKNQKT